MAFHKFVCTNCSHKDYLNIDSDLVTDMLVSCSKCGSESHREVAGNMSVNSRVSLQRNNKARDFHDRLDETDANLNNMIEEGKITSEQKGKLYKLRKTITGGEY